jgi:hypothetical protein|eukprot:COSAG01_NODE_2100_length_8429_cov_29.066507_14_plen_88_part_00
MQRERESCVRQRAALAVAAAFFPAPDAPAVYWCHTSSLALVQFLCAHADESFCHEYGLADPDIRSLARSRAKQAWIGLFQRFMRSLQ